MSTNEFKIKYKQRNYKNMKGIFNLGKRNPFLSMAEKTKRKYRSIVTCNYKIKILLKISCAI